MKATGERKILLEALHRILPVASGRATNPIQSCVRLATKAGHMQLSAVNSSFAIKTRAAVETSGDPIVLEAARLYQTMSFMSGDQVSLEPSGQRLRIKSGRADVALPLHDTNDWHTLPVSDLQQPVTVKAERLYAAAVGVMSIAEDCHDNFALGTIRVDRAGDKVSFVGSNGRMLVARTIACQPGGATEFGAMIPIKLARMFNSLKGDVELRTNTNSILACDGTTTIAATQVNGRYIPWRKVLDQKKVGTPVVVPVAPLIAACRLAGVTAQKNADKPLSPKLKISIADGELRISCQAELGEVVDVIPVATDAAGQAELNASYLQSMLSHCGQESLTCRFAEDLHVEADGFEGFICGYTEVDA
jgi:DNA polymerase III sliding clamp (beta) subunit (PCNA family)